MSFLHKKKSVNDTDNWWVWKYNLSLTISLEIIFEFHKKKTITFEKNINEIYNEYYKNFILLDRIFNECVKVLSKKRMC